MNPVRNLRPLAINSIVPLIDHWLLQSSGSYLLVVACWLNLFSSKHCSAAEAYIPSASQGTVSVVDTVSGMIVRTLDVGASPFGVAVGPAGRSVYVLNRADDSMSVIDATVGRVATLAVGISPFGIAASPDGTRVYISNQQSSWETGTVSVFDVVSSRIIAHIAVGAFPSGIAVHPNGERVYVVSGSGRWRGKGFSVIETRTNTVVETAKLTWRDPENSGDRVDPFRERVVISPFGVAIHPTGDQLYFSNRGSDNVAVVDLETLTLTTVVPVGRLPAGIAIDPQGTSVYVANKQGDSVMVIDTKTHQVVQTIDVGGSPMGVAVTPDGAAVYVTNLYDGTVSVIDTASHSVKQTIKVGPSLRAFGAFIGPDSPIQERNE